MPGVRWGTCGASRGPRVAPRSRDPGGVCGVRVESSWSRRACEKSRWTSLRSRRLEEAFARRARRAASVRHRRMIKVREKKCAALGCRSPCGLPALPREGGQKPGGELTQCYKEVAIEVAAGEMVPSSAPEGLEVPGGEGVRLEGRNGGTVKGSELSASGSSGDRTR